MKHYPIANVTLSGAGTNTYLLRVPQHNDFEYANLYATLDSEGLSISSCTWQLMEEDGTTAISAATAFDSRGAAAGYSNGVAAAPQIKITITVTGAGEAGTLKVDGLLARV